MLTRTLDETETTLRAIARVRLLALLAQHQVGGVASLYQIERAFRPARGAWLRSWAADQARPAGDGRGSSRPGVSSPSTRSRAADVETRSRPTQVGAVDAGGVVVG